MGSAISYVQDLTVQKCRYTVHQWHGERRLPNAIKLNPRNELNFCFKSQFE